MLVNQPHVIPSRRWGGCTQGQYLNLVIVSNTEPMKRTTQVNMFRIPLLSESYIKILQQWGTVCKVNQKL